MERLQDIAQTAVTSALCFLAFVGLVIALRMAMWVGLYLHRMPLREQAAWRLLPAAVWAMLRWRWLTRQIGLAPVDRAEQKTTRRSFAPLANFLGQRVEKPAAKPRYTKVQIVPDAYSLVAHVDTVPGVSRADIEAKTEYFRNQWKCHRVQVSQPRPGRVIVRGMRRDPLAGMLTMDGAPDGAYTQPTDRTVYLGRDEWGRHRWLDLSGITGITVGGLPRFGKTALLNGALYQLAASSAVQLAILDGKGGNDYNEWQKRAWFYVGDDIDDALSRLRQLVDLMQQRQRQVRHHLGAKNGWDVGPSAGWPLVLIILDECHSFFDERQAGGDSKRKGKYAEAQALVAQLVKKAGSVMMLTVLITQKQTGDAIPTTIRDNCTVGLSFAVKTRDAAVAALGESIREHSSFCPSQLNERPTYIGICVAALPDAPEPFVRLRVPYIPDDVSDARADDSAPLRADPSELLAPSLHPIPDDVDAAA